MNKRVRDLINESGAGLWGTDKARERLQKDTPGQPIKSLVKKSQKVSEAMSDSEKHQALQKKIADVRRQYRAGTWDGNVNKDGKPVIHVDGKPVIVEDVKNPYKAYDNQKLQQLKRNMRDNVANLTQRIRKRAGNASQSLKDELKDLERKSKLIDLALRDSAKQSDAKRAGVGSDRETFRDRQKRLGKPQTEQVTDKGLKMVNKNGSVVYATRDKVKHYQDLGYKSAAYMDARKDTLSRSNINPDKAFSDVRRIAKDLKNKKPGDTPQRYEAVDDSQKEAIRKKIDALDAHQDSLDKQAQAKQEEKRRIRQQNVDNNTKAIAIKNIDRILDRLDDVHRRVQTEKELLRDKLSESVQLNELKISFKFDKLADAARAERKAMQMKKLDVDSEKIQGKNMWLLHVTGNYTDIMKYIKRVDLEDKVHESKEMSLDDIKKRYAKEIIAFQDGGKDLSSGAKMALYGYIGSDGLKTDDADEFDDFVMGLQMGKYKKESLDEGSESWEDGYKRRVVKTTKPEHKEKGYNWRIKGKDKAHLTIKLYKDKPSQEEFNKQMKRVAGHEFGG